MSEKTRLDFKPVHKGLGFHPFSDGMPYAPHAPIHTPQAPKRPVIPGAAPAPSTGTGATVAGPIRVAPQIRGRPLHELQAAVAATPAPLVAPQIEHRFGMGYLALRLVAFAIDVAFHLAVSALALMGVMSLMGHEPLVLFESGIIELACLFMIALSWALITAQEVALGTTPGKRIVGLKLRGSAAAIFMRSFFFIPSVLFMGVGLFWSLFNRERRCWHDSAADLQPTRLARL